MGRNGRYLDPGPLTGVLDQEKAIEARLWFERVSTRAARRHERRLRRAGVPYQTLTLAVILPSGIMAPHRLSKTYLAKLRKAMQRYARALPANSFFAGMLRPTTWSTDAPASSTGNGTATSSWSCPAGDCGGPARWCAKPSRSGVIPPGVSTGPS